MKTFTYVGLLCLLLTGCGGSGASTPATASQPSLADLRSAPVQATVSSDTLLMSATLIRNLQPTVGTVASSLAGVLTVTSKDGSPIPGGVSVVSAYVVQGDQSGAFTTLLPITPRTSDAATIGLNIVGGPALLPGSRAAVVVLLRDAAGNPYLLQTPNVLIIAAD